MNCLCDSSILQKDEKNNNTSDSEEEKEVLNFKTLSKSFISSLLDFNIEVIFCYNLVFDTKILVKNIGFYCMLILNVLQIIFLCIFLIKKLKPIQNFMSNYSGNKKVQSYPPKKNKSNQNINDILNINQNNKNNLFSNNKEKAKKYPKDKIKDLISDSKNSNEVFTKIKPKKKSQKEK